jgi:hypothetical protein
MHINSSKNAHSWEAFRITFASRNKETIGSNVFLLHSVFIYYLFIKKFIYYGKVCIKRKHFR